MKSEENKKGQAARKTPLGIERRFDRFGDWLDRSWALQKANPLLIQYPKVLVVLTWIMRIAVGSVFIVSGLSKGIDPWGTFYKTMEYMTAMHLPIYEWGNTVLVLTFLLFTFEFLIGVSLCTGSFRKAAPILAALFMLVMLPLTLWIAVSDPVADCGCFGDFIVISNWATFIKNCVISVAVVWLIKFNGKCRCMITPYLQWIAAVATGAYILTIGYIGYWQQPMIDFRPFKTGLMLFASDDEAEFIPVYEFIYEKDGKEIKISENDELPDENEGWKFVRREETGFIENKSSKEQTYEPSADFRVWSEDGEEDVTDMLRGFEKQMILLVPDISQLSMSTSWKINELYDMSKDNNTEFFAIVAGGQAAINEWLDLSSGQYPIYTAEDTSIKELARGNPALVSLENGIITWKSALSALNLDDEKDEVVISTSPLPIDMTGEKAFAYLSLLLISILGILALASQLLVTPFFSGRINPEKDKE